MSRRRTRSRDVARREANLPSRWTDFRKIAALVHAEAGIVLTEGKAIWSIRGWPSACALIGWTASATTAAGRQRGRAPTSARR